MLDSGRSLIRRIATEPREVFEFSTCCSCITIVQVMSLLKLGRQAGVGLRNHVSFLRPSSELRLTTCGQRQCQIKRHTCSSSAPHLPFPNSVVRVPTNIISSPRQQPRIRNIHVPTIPPTSPEIISSNKQPVPQHNTTQRNTCPIWHPILIWTWTLSMITTTTRRLHRHLNLVILATPQKSRMRPFISFACSSRMTASRQIWTPLPC